MTPSPWPSTTAGRSEGWCFIRTAAPKQYTSAQYRQLLHANGITHSFSRPRQCWDNAVAEAWFGTLKAELIDRRSWANRDKARRAIFEFIEVFYNRQRLHSSLAYLSPAEYESTKIHQHNAAQAA